jgi:hypothetical protein
MKRYSTMMALFAMTTLVGTTAWAGYRWGSPVIIDTAARSAQGTMGTVRSSADNVQSIGCAVRASTGGPSAAVYCYATDSAGTDVQCYVAAPIFVEAASAITSNSHLSFKWNAAGVCTYLSVENYSSNAPIGP